MSALVLAVNLCLLISTPARAASSDAEILTYSLPGQTGPAIITSGPATIAVTLPFGSVVTALVATFTTSANTTSVAVSGANQTSAVTPNDFTNPVTYQVTAEDGTTVKSWVVTVTVAAPSNVATLGNLTISQGTLTPVFASATANYTATVANGVASMTVTPTVSEGHATVTVNGQTVISASPSQSLSLNVGANTITIVVTAQDATTRTYTITVTRGAAPLSNDATLGNLTISQGTLTPVFASATANYTATVANGVTSMTVTPTVSEGHATVTVNGQTVISASPSQSLSLNVGANTITIVVTAQDATTRTYTITVTRGAAPLSNDSTLSNLTISQGTLTPVFASATANYTATVANGVTSMTVTPTVSESHATVTVNGQTVISASPSQSLSLNVGANTITIVVTAQDATTRTYTITVTRGAAPLSNDATLSNLTISQGTLTPVFASATANYTATVANGVASMTVTPTVSESHATVTVNGQTVISASPSQSLSLNVGANTITIVVTAQDTTTTGPTP